MSPSSLFKRLALQQLRDRRHHCQLPDGALSSHFNVPAAPINKG